MLCTLGCKHRRMLVWSQLPPKHGSFLCAEHVCSGILRCRRVRLHAFFGELHRSLCFGVSKAMCQVCKPRVYRVHRVEPYTAVKHSRVSTVCQSMNRHGSYECRLCSLLFSARLLVAVCLLRRFLHKLYRLDRVGAKVSECPNSC